MPEGPSIFILKELITPHLKGKKIIKAFGNAKINMTQLAGKKISDIRCWGKQLLIFTGDVTIRIHLLMFGSYSIDENKKPTRSLRLALVVPKHTVYFYTCSVRLLPANVDKLYDWKADVLSNEWDPVKARKKLKAIPNTMICDALLDQQIFSGVGNIIKNEVLYRVKLHPENIIEDIPSLKLSAVIKEARNYSFDFLKWKKEFTLKKHWLAHTKKICLRCNLPIIKKYCGKTKRRTFFCCGCQVRYN
ncbi:MAG TPA: DNA-formamidopyrimidine glycosylase family protein [Chitinophagaceae bacterium]|jgi:endonuclease-8|nr:DNA-formamidopyrimidine glycosylase family protein [Chitinophagaceae bacterium]